MTISRQFFAMPVVFAIALFLAARIPAVNAMELIINADQDTYIRGGGNANNNFNDDKLVTGFGRVPLVQFDLSSVAGMTIVDAYIRGYLFEDPDTDYTTAPFEQLMYLARTDPNNSTFDGGMDETTMTASIYGGDWNDDEVLMESLGHYAESSTGVPNAYKDFNSSSEADLAELNARVKTSNANQRFALFYIESQLSGAGRWWDDHEGGNPMQLVLDVIPDPLPEVVIDRSTGNMRLQNNSGAPITNVLGYEMTSNVGAFDQTEWIPISGHYDGQGDSSVDDDNWTVLSHSGDFTDLSEVSFGGNGMNMADGLDKDLGDVWIQNRLEDVSLELLLTDGTIKPATVTFVGGNGSAYERSDLDFDNDIDTDDYVKFSNGLDANLSGLSPAQAYQMGDLDYNGVNSFDDFVLFVSDYETFNGEGSFAAMLASIPEPSSALLLSAACCCLLGRRKPIGESLPLQ